MRRRWINLLQWFGLAPPTTITVSRGIDTSFMIEDLEVDESRFEMLMAGEDTFDPYKD